MFGVGSGIDFAVTRWLSLGAALRLGWTFFADEAPQLGANPLERAHSYGSLTAASLTVGATWKAFD